MTIEKTLEALKRFSFRERMTEAQLRDLAGLMSEREAPAGTLLFREGDPGDRMFLIVKGHVRIAKGTGKELALLSEGELFGELSLIDSSPRSANAVTESEVLLLSLGREELLGWARRTPEGAVAFLSELMRTLARRLRRTSGELVLWHDLARLALEDFRDDAEVLKAVMALLVPRLEGDWSGAGYLPGSVEGAVERAAAEGPHGADQPQRLALAELRNRWLNPATYVFALPSRGSQACGLIAMRNEKPMSAAERAEAETTFLAVSEFLSLLLSGARTPKEEPFPEFTDIGCGD